MFNRPVSEASSAPGLAGAGPARAELAVTTPSGSVELPSQAVAEAATNHQIQEDHHRLVHNAGVLGRLRAEIDGVHRTKKEIEDVEELRAKLMLAYRGVEETTETQAELPPMLRSQVEEGLVNAELVLGAQEQAARLETANLFKPKEVAPSLDQPIVDKRRVLSKIADALDRIGLLRDKLGRSEQEGYEKLLGLNLSVSGLNSARTLVDDSAYSVTAASATVENILMNVRAAVVAHGRASPDIVRLVLTS